MRRIVGLFLICCSLSACLTQGVLTGAQLVYDSHDISKEIKNHNIQAEASRRLFKGHSDFRAANISVSSFNHDLILVGQVPSAAMRQKVAAVVKDIPGMRRLFNELEVRPNVPLATQMTDSWITAKIRTKLLADSDIDHKAFKIITEDGVVFVLGDVKEPQAQQVITIARQTSGVHRVVRILRYYHFQDKANSKYPQKIVLLAQDNVQTA